MGIITFLRDWVIPIVAVLLSVWFAASARRDSENAQKNLKQINEAIQGWQSEIMKATTELLNTMPQVIDGKVKLADAKTRNDAMAIAVERIKKTLEDGSSAYVEGKAMDELGSIVRQLSGLRE